MSARTNAVQLVQKDNCLLCTLILPRTNPQRCPVWTLLKVSRVRRIKNRITIKANITTEARAREKIEGKRD